METAVNLRNLNIKWIIVPHEIKKREIKRIIKNRNGNHICYSEIKDYSNSNFLIVDVVGILSYIYKYANVVFIGGGFNKFGIHSILEPAVFGSFVCFGPNHRNYKEALDLIRNGGAEIIHNSRELTKCIKQHCSDNIKLSAVKRKNKDYIFNHSGAVENTFNALFQKISGK